MYILPPSALIIWKDKHNKMVTVVVSGENVLAEEQQLKETFIYPIDFLYLLNITPYAKNYRFLQK